MDNNILVQRLGTLEDLMRRSEGGISHVLSRLKDVELAVSQVSKAQEKTAPEVRYLYEELNNVKRQVNTVDQTWRQTYSDFSGSIQTEVRGRLPQQVDAISQQLRQENANMKAEVQDMHQLVRRAAEQWNTEMHDMRQVAQTTTWKVDQMQTALGQQHQQYTSLERRVDQDAHDLRSFASEVERNASSFRQFVESAVRSAHADLAQRVEVEQRSRDALQQDVQSTIFKLREDVVRGLSHASATSKVLEENVNTLESVLRAEVRSRMSKTDELHAKLDQVLSEMERDATSAANVLQGLDDEGGAMASTMHNTQTQMDKLWGEVQRLKQQQQQQQHTTPRGAGAPRNIGSSSKQQPPPQGGDAADTDPELMMVDLEEDAASDAESVNTDTAPEAIVERMGHLSHKLRQKASLKQVQALKEAMYRSMRQQIDRTFVEMADKLERDQSSVEEYLSALKGQLGTIEQRYQEQEKALQAVRRAGEAVKRAPAGEADLPSSVASPQRSASARTASSAQETTDEAYTPSARSSARSSASNVIRRSRPPSENHNVMREI